MDEDVTGMFRISEISVISMIGTDDIIEWSNSNIIGGQMTDPITS